MSWDGLAVGALWPKCHHARTPENTQKGHRQSARCRLCHQQRARDYLEKKRNEKIARGEELRGRGRPRIDNDDVLDGEPSLTQEQLAALGREELTRLDAWGIKGCEFDRARKRSTKGASR